MSARQLQLGEQPDEASGSSESTTGSARDAERALRAKSDSSTAGPPATGSTPGSPTHAVTLWQPWATWIADGLKDIENRTWNPHWMIGARIAIHAGKHFGVSEWPVHVPMLHERAYPRGVVLAVATIADVVTTHDSKWFVGPYGWVLRDVVRLARPVPAKGAQGLWRLPPDVARQIREAA